MKTSGLTGAVLGVAAVFGLSWIAAIAYWRLGTRVPGPGEIAGVMLGMPAGLAGLLTWWRHRAPPDSRLPATHEASAETNTGTPPVRAGIRVRAAALELPIGNDPAAVLAIAGTGVGLSLHPQLRDPQGFGVLAAEVPGLDTAPTAAELADVAEAGTPVRPETVRALSLAEPVLEQLLACGGPTPRTARLMLPGTWSEVERGVARRWLERRLGALGPEPGIRVLVEAMASGRELFDAMRDNTQEGPVLWLAASSNIGAGTIERWSQRGTLLGASRPQGRAPGEAAAGVVLDTGVVATGEVLLHFPDSMKASAGQAGDDELQALFDTVLPAGGVVPADIGLLVSDVDHHPGRCAQLAGLTSARLPHLDPGQGVLRLGQACGHADAVQSLAAIVLCAHAAREQGQASLAVAFDDAKEPAPALVLPPSP